MMSYHESNLGEDSQRLKWVTVFKKNSLILSIAYIISKTLQVARKNLTAKNAYKPPGHPPRLSTPKLFGNTIFKLQYSEP